MGMKGKLGMIFALGAMFESMNARGGGGGSTFKPIRKVKTWDEVLLGRGLKKFNINGIDIIALNKKNAERKYKLYHS